MTVISDMKQHEAL